MKDGNFTGKAFLRLYVALCIICLPCYAFKLTPIYATFAPEGREATRIFQVDNPGDSKIAVQISMAHRKVDLDGKEDLPKADKSFQLYPSHLILQPGQRRNIRVSWIGSKKPDRELTSRIIAEQLPVKGLSEKKKKGAFIKILMRYIGSVYVEPQGVKAKIEIEKWKLIEGEKLSLVIYNSGSKHQLLREPELRIKVNDGAKSVEHKTEVIKELNGQNILAAGRRRFIVKLPLTVSGSITSLALDIKE